MLVRAVPFLGCLFSAENKPWGIIFGKKTFQGIDFDQVSLIWLTFRIVVTILGYKFSMACKFWGIVYAKIYKF